MANWWDSYMTDTPSYLDPNLTGYYPNSSVGGIDLSNSSPQWWNSPTYSDPSYGTSYPSAGDTWSNTQNSNYTWSPTGDASVTGPTGGNWWDSVPSFLSSGAGALLSGGAQLAGGLLSGNAAKGAAQTSADAQLQAARIAADAAKFRPVGVTTNFGSSNFGYDTNGNINSAGYSLSPQLKSQQNTLMGASSPLLSQFTGAQAATAPMGQAANTMMGLGNSYLSTTPQQQAQQYMNEQQALLAAPRANELAGIRERLNALGRGGLAIGGNAGEMATNPEYAAYYNALRQQDLELASKATQAGMDYAKFGGGLVGLGGDMLNSMYGVQSNAYQPYATALGGAAKIEGLGQQALDTGINIGAKGTASNALSGQLMMNGLNNAAATMQDVNKISPWGTVLTSAGGMLNNYMNPQQQRFNPYTGQPLTQFGQ